MPRRFVSVRSRPVAFAIAAAVILVAISLGARRTDLAQAAPLGSIDGQRWIDSPDVAVTIERDPSDDRDFYWRAVAYDRIDTHGANVSHPTKTTRPPATSLFAGMAEDVAQPGSVAWHSRFSRCRSPTRSCCLPRRRSKSTEPSG